MLRRATAITLLTGASLFFASRFHGSTEEPLLVAAEPVAPLTSTTTLVVTTEPPLPSSTTTTTTTMAPTTTIAIPEDVDGRETFVGSRAYTNWGWVMVEVSVLDGVMVDVEMVITPRATKRSEGLTEEYQPIMRQQALERQSPEVDMITGATVLVLGYRASVRAAMKDAELWPTSVE